tara:strand:+ start:1810 stop:2232 length:423 start_codon:yes stop_codon:yes gene_type:complete
MTIEVGAGGGAPLIQLAPDLTYPSDKNGTSLYKTITGIDGSSGLVTALSLTGAFAVSAIALRNFTAETATIKLTVDGEEKWNDTYTIQAGTLYFIGGPVSTSGVYSDIVPCCKETFLLEIATTTDTDIEVNYVARPIIWD